MMFSSPLPVSPGVVGNRWLTNTFTASNGSIARTGGRRDGNSRDSRSLPLGEAMLARDLFALAVAATSLDHRRRLRRRLGVRRARGDRLERIYQVRIDLVAFDRRMRAEIPVRDWVLPIVARIGRFIPEKRRGDRESRARRLAIESGIDRAITQSGDSDAYRRWCKVLRSWHDLASDGRLHETPVSVFASAGRFQGRGWDQS